MTDCLVVYIEKDIFVKIENNVILRRFQNMSSRRIQLPKSQKFYIDFMYQVPFVGL